MRIWSLHPSLLDRMGLIACWRETLWAKKVLLNLTKRNKNHSQLIRFKEQSEPIAFIERYLEILWLESKQRNYKFNPEKVKFNQKGPKIPVTSDQIIYEFRHLQNKLRNRANQKFQQNEIALQESKILINPLFEMVPGPIEKWEKVK